VSLVGPRILASPKSDPRNLVAPKTPQPTPAHEHDLGWHLYFCVGLQNRRANRLQTRFASAELFSARKIWGQLGSKTRPKLAPFAVRTPARATESTRLWRKRVGVEPTIRPAKDRIAGFEGREDHRTPFASIRSIGVRRGQFQLFQRGPSCGSALQQGRRA
jgi:hypothetical protein